MRRYALLTSLVAAVLAASLACTKPADRPPAGGSSGADAPGSAEGGLAAGIDAPPAPALPSLTTWHLDPENSSVTFVCKHAMHTKVRGMFQRPSGTVVLDDATPSNSTITATVDVSTVTTGVEERDTHLKGPDFFAAATHPVVTFTSTGVTRQSAASYTVTGNLTMHGVTKPVTLAVTASPPFQHFGTTRRGIEATTSIRRIEFGVGVAAWNVAAESGGMLIGDEVAITIDAELVLQGAPASPSPR